MPTGQRQAAQKRAMPKTQATLLAAALLTAFPVWADDKLLDILRGKAILTDDEYCSRRVEAGRVGSCRGEPLGRVEGQGHSDGTGISGIEAAGQGR